MEFYYLFFIVDFNRFGTRGLSDAIYKLRLRDIDSRFTRRNYDNIQSKSQVLVSMLQQNKIHPRLAFTSCGLFCDAENAYQMSMDYYEEQNEKAAKQVTTQTPTVEEVPDESEKANND